MLTLKQAKEFADRNKDGFTVGVENLGPLNGRRYFVRTINTMPVMCFAIKQRTYSFLKWNYRLTA